MSGVETKKASSVRARPNLINIIKTLHQTILTTGALMLQLSLSTQK